MSFKFTTFQPATLDARAFARMASMEVMNRDDYFTTACRLELGAPIPKEALRRQVVQYLRRSDYAYGRACACWYAAFHLIGAIKTPVPIYCDPEALAAK